MGFDIAAVAARLGAEVILISGPSHCVVSDSKISLIRVVSAVEMYEACHQHYADSDVVICAAAIADYRPKHVADKKIKKNENSLIIELEKTTDVLASLGQNKESQFLVGFALETNDEIDNAKLKIQKKNLDLIVLNSLQDEGAGFGKQTNKVTFIDKNFTVQAMDLKLKEAVAEDIINKIIELSHA
jgi:phosphopantothenoylcysteine decarboxylase/phosphopantothenate--cysteine ligase